MHLSSIDLENLAAIVAPNTFILGIVDFFMRAILAIETTKLRQAILLIPKFRKQIEVAQDYTGKEVGSKCYVQCKYRPEIGYFIICTRK
ncbi:UNVERIFIED_CONTAM: hypothetical protein NCL1_21509 [Trichonephila clavipes]